MTGRRYEVDKKDGREDIGSRQEDGREETGLDGREGQGRMTELEG